MCKKWEKRGKNFKQKLEVILGVTVEQTVLWRNITANKYFMKDAKKTTHHTALNECYE